MSEAVGPDEVGSQALEYGLKSKDVFIVLGQMSPGTAMAGEAAGVVTATRIGSRGVGVDVVLNRKHAGKL
ncbi:hypothetical protein LX36DRAFT_713429 [Colletotrichum falcatum]|nr:hypothetical protein LX36DRAFT_713429 [Colletotrichum falcatum]